MAAGTKHARAVLAYASAYAVTLLCFVIVWLAYPALLYIGRDADLSLWLGRTHSEWAAPLGVTAMNPIQGMTSMALTINDTFNPAAWVFYTDLADTTKKVVSFVLYFVEVTATALLLGVALGFSPSFAFVASLWTSFLLFPPFNFVFGLQGWLATAPYYGHAIALSNLLLVAFVALGAPSRFSFAGQFLRNAALAFGILLVVLLIVLAAPFYNGGMLVGTFLLCGVILLASHSYRQMLWRIAAGLFVVAACAALHFPEFYAGAMSSSARFAGGQRSLLDLRWPEISLTAAREGLCAWGVVCERLTHWPVALTGSYWLQASVLVGGALIAARTLFPTARVGIAFTAMWAVLLCVWLGANLGINAWLPLSPLYVYLMMVPLLGIFSLYALFTLIEVARSFINIPGDRDLWSAGIVCVLALSLIPLYRVSPARIRAAAPAPDRTTAIIETLEREIALRPGDSFRGSVATIIGAPGSPLRQRLFGNAPLASGDFETLLREVGKVTGSSHDLLDLWWRRIPTLSEYGQGISKGLAFFVSNMLNDHSDATEPYFVFPRLAHIDLLRAMGVRFIISDLDIPTTHARLVHAIVAKDDKLFLYELPRPNTGTFSPSRLEGALSADDLRGRLTSQPGLLETSAFVDHSGGANDLVPAKSPAITFEKGAIHVTASSESKSALLLPVQFSHCYRIAADARGAPQLLRANLLHTLVLFTGSLDMRLNWRFGFWSNAGCRLQDAADARVTGLH